MSEPMNNCLSRRLVIWALLAFVVAGCAKTRLTRVQDPDYSGRSFGAPAIFAETADLQRRQLLEEALAAELGHRGVKARSSIELLPPAREYTPQERFDTLQRAGVDSLIVVAAQRS